MVLPFNGIERDSGEQLFPLSGGSVKCLGLFREGSGKAVWLPSLCFRCAFAVLSLCFRCAFVVLSLCFRCGTVAASQTPVNVWRRDARRFIHAFRPMERLNTKTRACQNSEKCFNRPVLVAALGSVPAIVLLLAGWLAGWLVDWLIG